MTETMQVYLNSQLICFLFQSLMHAPAKLNRNYCFSELSNQDSPIPALTRINRTKQNQASRTPLGDLASWLFTASTLCRLADKGEGCRASVAWRKQDSTCRRFSNDIFLTGISNKAETKHKDVPRNRVMLNKLLEIGVKDRSILKQRWEPLFLKSLITDRHCGNKQNQTKPQRNGENQWKIILRHRQLNTTSVQDKKNPFYWIYPDNRSNKALTLHSKGDNFACQQLLDTSAKHEITHLFKGKSIATKPQDHIYFVGTPVPIKPALHGAKAQRCTCLRITLSTSNWTRIGYYSRIQLTSENQDEMSTPHEFC